MKNKNQTASGFQKQKQSVPPSVRQFPEDEDLVDKNQELETATESKARKEKEVLDQERARRALIDDNK